MADASTLEKLQIRIHGADHLPTLIYLPGLHGDWTLIGDFRKHLAGKVRFVEFTYPRSLTWSLDDYAEAIETSLAQNRIASGWLPARMIASAENFFRAASCHASWEP